MLRCQQQVLSADRLTEVAGQGKQLVDDTAKLCAGADVVRPGGVLTHRTAQGLSQYAPLFFQRLPAQQRQTLLQRRAQNRLGRLDKARCELVKQSTNFFGSANQQFAVLLCRITFLRDSLQQACQQSGKFSQFRQTHPACIICQTSR